MVPLTTKLKTNPSSPTIFNLKLPDREIHLNADNGESMTLKMTNWFKISKTEQNRYYSLTLH